MSFFGSLFGGSNPTLNSDIGQTGGIAGFATGQGEGDTTAASTFWRSILSGDQSQISKSLAPEISAQQGQISQNKKQLAEFGTRSGGTASAAAGMDASGRSNLINLVGGLQSSAASGLASKSGSASGTGEGAYQDQAKLSQQQMENWSNSILGLGLTQGAGFLEKLGLSKNLRDSVEAPRKKRGNMANVEAFQSGWDAASGKSPKANPKKPTKLMKQPQTMNSDLDKASMSFKKGGTVKKTGVAKVHKGEQSFDRQTGQEV